MKLLSNYTNWLGGKGMNVIILNGNRMSSIKEAHNYIKRKLNFPDYYGGNLDALWDILSTVSKPTSIKLINFHKLRENLGEYSELLLSVFFDADKENDKVSFELIEDDEE